MRDVKGHVIGIARNKTIAIETFNLPVSTSDPLSEEGPPPAEGTNPVQPGPDRIFIDVDDPNITPCFALLPKVFPFPGGHSIPTGADADPAPTAAFIMWDTAMRYGIQHLQDKSIHAHDTLFNFDDIEKAQFDASERDLVTTFSTIVTYLTPEDPLCQSVTKHALLEKERAVLAYGSATAPLSPSRLAPHPVGTPALTTASPTSVSDMSALIEGLSKAITNSKSMTSTERERATEADEVVNFYQLLLTSVHLVPFRLLMGRIHNRRRR